MEAHPPHAPNRDAASALAPAPAEPADFDQRVLLRGMSWKDFEILLAVRGDRSGVRLSYLEGDIELMSPSYNHERRKKTIARLVEAYADERGLELNGFGSWTLKSPPDERGIEPDECYTAGVTSKDVPDLAIEVVWTSGGLDKLKIYRGLGVREVWVWERTSGLAVHVLRGDSYQEVPRSEVLPDLDMGLLSRFLLEPSQSQAVRAFRAALRGG